MSVDVRQGDTEGLDRTRRYLRPVADYDTDETHLSVYGWLPAFEAWATGMSLCGGSMRQGPLPEGTVVSCQGCLDYQPKYERYLAPGYDPADDDPDVLRKRAEAAERQLAQARTLVEEMHAAMGAWLEQARPPAPVARHVGGGANAEDCLGCEGTNPPYPFLCPGEPG